MDVKTLTIYMIMYIYGFGLMIWAIFFDKAPTKKTRYSAMIGLTMLLLTLIYVLYVLWKFGIQ